MKINILLKLLCNNDVRRNGQYNNIDAAILFCICRKKVRGMKKLFTSFFFILIVLFVPLLSIQGMSRTEIYASPQRYIKIGEKWGCECYMDKDSIQSLENNPPIYKLSVNSYTIMDFSSANSTSNSFVMTDNIIFSYDYNLSTQKMIEKVNNECPNIYQRTMAYNYLRTQNSGITSDKSHFEMYSLDGVKKEYPSATLLDHHTNVQFNSLDYQLAIQAFKIVYNIDF